MNYELRNLTIKKAVNAIKSGELKSVDLIQHHLKNISEKDREIGAYLEVFEDALEKAKEIDEKIAKGEEAGALAGIPIATKDNIMIEGKRATSASKILENYRAVFDSTVADRLKKAGAILIGRTNMDEFAMGSSTENSGYQITKNPLDLKRVPGGSSGGSAAALAGDMCLGALGSDTGGSIRTPASFCGLVGLKPTYGAVSRHGLMAMGSSLDQIGPLAKTVDDAEILFDVIKGRDKMDSTSRDHPEKIPLKNKRIGIPKGFVGEGVSAEVLKNFNDTIEGLKKEGFEIVEIDLPNIKYSLPVYYVIMPAEVSANLSRFDGVRYGLHIEGDNLLEEYMKTRGQGFGREARRRIILGSYVLSAGYYDAYYKKAEEVRSLIRADFEKVFNGENAVSAIATPTALDTAFKIGEKTDDPLKMYLEDIFTVTANVAGIPAISIPSGLIEKDGKKLPIGFQIMAPHFRENWLFEIGREVEKIAKI